MQEGVKKRKKLSIAILDSVRSMKQKPRPNLMNFTKLVDRVLSVPHAEILRREKEYREQMEQNPKRRGPSGRLSLPPSATNQAIRISFAFLQVYQ